MSSTTAEPSKAELRRQHTLARRSHNAAEVLGSQGESVALQPQLSFTARTLRAALPQSLLDQGRIAFDPQGQPRVAHYDPALLAPNPQRGRVVDRNLEELAASLDTHGQQEALIARLITATDRQRWPDAFAAGQLLLILKGHRIFHAQPKTKLAKLRVELLLPFESEDDLAYARRALRRAAIKMMHSQGYDIFDKVNQYAIWREEFALAKPKDSDVAAYFEISRTEAQRVKVVSQLHPEVAQQIINSDKRPADEVVFYIASRPPEEHADAYQRYGHLTVATARRLYQQEKESPPISPVTGSGRPRNYVFAVRAEQFDITYISSGLTAKQWKAKGGSKAFWDALRALVNNKDIQDRLNADLA